MPRARTSESAAHSSSPVSVRAGFRPEVQALRAVAVLAVIAYHFWPDRIRGGYVGVDVFFAISGYLIIGHLLREVDRTGTVRLLGFWGRRARRLLPASLLVLVATGVAILLWVPQAFWHQYFQEIGASAVYVQNWLLAYNAVDYLGAANTPSPVQHFWSLSVEEQFYIAWPLVIIAVLVVLRLGRAIAHSRAVLGGVLLVLTVASFIASVLLTTSEPASAYFVTTTRAWEFGLGGLLAWLLVRHSPARDQVAAVVSWVGLIMIAIAVLAYTPQTPFPGFAAALPAVGTLLVIAGGMSTARWAPTAVFRLKPVQWVGDTSYSIYLWHWPALIITPFVLGHPLGLLAKAAVLVGVLVLSWASRRFVEDRFRVARSTADRPWRVVVAAVVASALVFGGSLAATRSLEARIDAARAHIVDLIDDGVECVGATAFGGGADCARPFAVTPLTDPAIAALDIGNGVRVQDDCKQTLTDSAVIVCEFGDTIDPALTVALVGDSHAGQFLEPLKLYAERHSWRLLTFLKTWCAGTGEPGIAATDSQSPAAVESCTTWGERTLERIADDPRIDVAVFSNFTDRYTTGVPASLGRPATASDFTSAWGRVTTAGKRVVVLRDVPNAAGTNIPPCVAVHMDEYDPCATARDLAIPAADPQWTAASSSSVGTLDLSDRLCDQRLCHAVIGGVIAYFDGNHLSASYALSLAEVLGDGIAEQVRR